MEVFTTVIFLIICLVFGFACGSIAKSKNRNQRAWFFGGVVLGIIGLIIIALLPKLNKTKQA